MEIVKYPNPILNESAKPISEITDEIKALATEMIETMHVAQGVGLAGPQVGVSKQIIVVNHSGEVGEESVYINPRIINKKSFESDTEGCLSLPEISGTVRRSKKITVEATLLSGKEVTFEVEDFEARVIQHEIDHLLGILFITKIEPTEKIAIKSQLRHLEEEYKK